MARTSPSSPTTQAVKRGCGWVGGGCRRSDRAGSVLTVLGKTGLTASRIGLGLAALGRPGYITLGHAADLAGRTDVRSMEAAAHAILDAAYAHGVRYFDAARSYGKAEQFLGAWLSRRGLGPDEVTVG